MTIKIHDITQPEANSLIEQLSGETLENFKLGFHDEKNNIVMNKRPIALSEKDRSYFLIKVDNTDYLLVGINLNPRKTLNLSSYARITTKLKGKAAICLKLLIEQKLVLLCQAHGKERIMSKAYTSHSITVFNKLTQFQINGIKDIKLNGDSLSITLEEKQ